MKTWAEKFLVWLRLAALCLCGSLAPQLAFAAAAPNITTQPQGQSVVLGFNAMFNVLASSQTPLFYQWSLNGTNLTDGAHLSGSTNATLTVSNVAASDAGNYSVTVSNSHGSITSSNATLTVLFPAAITSQPTDQSVLVSSNASFSVVATGTGSLNYQWQFEGTNLTNSGHISGTSTPTLNIANSQTNDAGSYQVIVTNAYGSVTSSVAALTVLVPAFVTFQPTNQFIVLTSNVTFSAGAGGTAPLSCQWYFNGTPLTDGGRISGSTTTNFDLSNVQTNDTGSYQIVVTNNYGSVTSGVATLTVLVPATITGQPTDQVTCFSGVALFSVSAGGTTPLNYQWFFNGAPLADDGQISGSATAALTVSDVSPANVGNYQVVVTNAYGSATSRIATLNATNRVFYVNISNTIPMAPYTDWSSAATNIQDAVDLAVAGDRVLVTNGIYYYGNRAAAGTINCVVVTNAISIASVNGPAQTVIDATFSKRCVYLGGGATLTGFSLTYGTAGSGNVGGGVCCDSTNDWVVNCSFAYDNGGGVTGSAGGGAYLGTLTNCTLTWNAAALGGGAEGSVLYNCEITGNSANDGAGAANCTLNNCLISNNSGGATGGGASYSALNGCTLVGNIANSEGGGAYSCTLSNCVLTANSAQGWSGGGCEFSTLYNCVVSNNVAAYVGGGADYSTLYNCLVIDNNATQNSGGGARNSTLVNCLVTGNFAYVGSATEGGTLLDCTVAGNSCTIDSNGAVDNGMATNCIIYGNTCYTRVANYGGTYGLSWCCTFPLPASGTGNITNAPLFVNPNNQFHLLAGSPGINTGNNIWVNSTTDLDGNPRIVNGTVDMGCYEYQNNPIIQTQPLGQTNTIGQTVALSVVATGSGLSYQWLFNGTNLTGATSATLILTNVQLTASGVYSVIVPNSLASVTSSNATLTIVYPPPVIVSQPASLNLFAGSTASFSANVVTYSPTAYQWFTNGVPLVDGGRISGSGTTNLTISNAQISDSANYELIATNNYGSATSSNALLAVYPVTTVAIQPQILTVPGGTNVTFTASVTGQGPFNYQWLFNNTNISGATGQNLALNNVLDSQSGAYALEVSNPAGTVVSSNDMLTVVPWIVPSISPSSIIAGQGNVQFTLTEGGFATNATYQWYQNGTSLGGLWFWSSPGVGTFITGPSVTNAGNYYVIGSDSYESATSSIAALTVIPLAITTQPASQTIFAGSTPTISVVAAGAPTINYQWQFNGASITGATNSSLAITNVGLPQAGIYSVLVANAYTNLVSSNATLNVLALSITSQPTNVVAWPNSTPSLSVNVAGQAPFGFDWQLNGVDVPGVWTNVLTLTNIQYSQFGIYDVIVSNAWGSVTATNIMLSLSQVAVWGGLEKETNLTVGLTNIVAIAASTLSNPGDCLALQSNGNVVEWPPLFSSKIVVSNILAIAGGNFRPAPFFMLQQNGSGLGVGLEVGPSELINAFPGVSNLVAIAADQSEPLALTSGGTVLLDNPLGNAGITFTNILTNAVAVAEGNGFYMALRPDGMVTCWGSNNSGQTNVPPGLSNVIAIAAGNAHALALKSDRTVVAWGQNSFGQTNVPAGLSNVVAIAAGYAHNLALKANGTVVAWGLNNAGQTNVPASLTNVMAIACGQYHSMALIGNGPPIMNVPLANPSVGTNGLTLSLPSQSGRVYVLQYKDSLSDTNWNSLPLVPGNGGTLILADPSATNPQRFYQVQKW